MKQLTCKESLYRQKKALSLGGKKRLGRIFSSAQKELSRAEAALSLALEKGGAITQNQRWIFDNAALLAELFASYKRQKKTVKKGLFVFFVRVLEEAEVRREDLDAIFCFLSDCGISHEEMLDVLPALLAAAASLLMARIASDGEVQGLIESVRSLSRERVDRYLSAYSPLHKLLQLNDDTFSKMAYEFRARLCQTIVRAARAAGRDTLEYAQTLLEKAQKTGEYIGKLLPQKRRCAGALYTLLVTVLGFVLGGVFSMILAREYPFGTAAVLGFLLAGQGAAAGAIALFDALFAKLSKPQALWRIQIDRLEKETATMVVYTAMVHSFEEIDALCEKLRRAAAACLAPVKNEQYLSFALLLDLPEAAQKEEPDDELLLSYAQEKIERLNAEYGAFYCFCRPRVRRSDGRYSGWERKRGALLSLVRFLSGEGGEIVCRAGNVARALSVRYLFTLDADTILVPGALRELVGILEHPLNHPVVTRRGGVATVTQGYGILQPRMVASAESAAQSLFSMLKTGAGGMTAYEGAAFDRAQTLFSHGHFCGKGLFHVPTFHAVLQDVFPDERILSHDLLEGARLSCAAASDVVLLDEVPATARAEAERAHRWCRGDVQALFFSGPSFRDRFGCRRKNPMPFYYRTALWDNLRRALIAPFSAALILLSPFVSAPSEAVFLISALSCYVIPALVDVAYVLFTARTRGVFLRFFSPIFAGVWQRLFNLLYDLSALFSAALLQADAILRALYRFCVSGQKCLEWKTASQSAAVKKDGLFSYLFARAPSLFAGLFLLFASACPLSHLLGLMWVLHPFCAWYLSRRSSDSTGLSDRAKETLRRYVCDQSRFFLQEVGEHTCHLPPDHVSVAPVALRAMRTSPTNIGLYLVSLCAMVDFSVIDVGRALCLMEKTLSTVEKLPKWRGLLYNWYDLESGQNLSGYVSSVDCGNFLASLYVLQGFLKECARAGEKVGALQARVSALLDEAKLKHLYSAQDELFCIGYDTQKGSFDNAHYDVYMSEARLTSFLAVARGEVPLRHWSALMRPLLSRRGYLGAASFSGTVFEYFMPQLFLPLPHASFESEALCFAAECSRAAAVPSPKGAVYGVSESAFFATDALGDYPYRANGLSSLALRADTAGHNVISPYSSFLMLPVLAEQALENLRRLKELGLYGDYGFYESATVLRAGADVVQSTFAHHAGMSIAAAANAVFSGVMRRRFLDHAENAAFLPLISQRVPAEGAVHTNLHRKRTTPHGAPRPERCLLSDKQQTGALVLPGKSSALLFDFEGEANVLWRQDGGLLLFCPSQLPEDSLVLRAVVDGVLYSSVRAENPSDAVLELAQISGGVCLRISHGARRVLFSFQLSGKREGICLQTELFGEAKSAAVSLSFSPLLAEEKAFYAHPAFRALSLMAERGEQALFIYARRGEGREYALCVCDEVQGKTGLGKVLFSDDLAEAGGGRKALFSHARPTCRRGVLNPCAVTLCRRLEGGFLRTQHSHRFLIGFGTRASAAFFAMRSLAQEARQNREQFEDAGRIFLRAVQNAGLASVGSTLARKLTRAVLSARGTRLLPSCSEQFRREDLYALGLSGDLPIVLCEAQNEENLPALREAAALFRYHAICGLCYDLVFFSSADGYERRGIHAAMAAVERAGAQYLLFARGGGIFLVEGDARTRELLQNAACGTLGGRFCALKAFRRPLICDVQRPPCAFLEQESLGENWGNFVKDGFFLQKEKLKSAADFSHVLASPTFGALLTQRSLGCTFETSSRFRRLTTAESDSLHALCGERLVLKTGEKAYDLAACSSHVLFAFGFAQYFGTAGDVEYRLTVFCHPTLLYRGVRAEFYTRQNCVAELSYEFEPVLADARGVLGAFSTRLAEDTLFFERAITPLSRPMVGYLKVSAEGIHRSEYGVGAVCKLRISSRREVAFYLGSKNSEEQFYRVSEYLGKVPFETQLSEAVSFAERRLPPRGKIDSERAEFTERWLCYQAIFSRLYARCGFYQPGGAYGFRDQLQDALLYLHFSFADCARQILRHAAHQFRQGDVLHWWHNLPDGQGRHCGVRTRISDDYLWLIYATCRYVQKTQDTELLLRPVPFLEGRELREGEHDLYASFAFGKKAPLWEHLLAAADLFCARGVGDKGLALMLDGDWNDGFDALGDGAQSVFLSQFGALCLMRLCRLMRQTGYRTELCARYEDFAHNLHRCARRAFVGRWYARAYFGDGEALGADATLSTPCSIDVLPQAFAAFCFCEFSEKSSEEKAHVFSGLQAVWEHLYDEKSGVLRLFTPPFGAQGRRVGYIRNYADGVRENGGQYTHAAVWYALACRAMAPFSEDAAFWKARAQTVMEGILPHRATQDAAFFSRYRIEPYLLAGDVYSAPEQLGRGGWSQYTGSAAWAWHYFQQKGEGELF